MATLLIKLRGYSTLKFIKQKSKCNAIGFRKSNFYLTAKHFCTKCKQPGFRTRLALPPDYDNVVDFMCEAYYKHEPAIVNIGLANTEAPPIWRAMMLEQIRNGYSIIAENSEHCLVGAALNSITDINESKRLSTLAKCCCGQGPISDVIEFFAYVSAMAKVWDRYCVWTVFEQSCVAVDASYQKLGIAKRLIEESWYLARDCGFRLFRLDCNSNYCANIARGFGWQMIWSIPFGQYVKNGNVVFKCVKEPHTTCRVFVDKLDYYKTFVLPYKRNVGGTPASKS